MAKNFLDASLHPPAEEAGAPGSYSVIDVRAYIADRRNATTAYGRMRNGHEIQFKNSPTKVVMIGEGGLMGFVDLWRGILVCDVLDCNSILHYMPFPRALRDNKKLDIDPVVARDVAVVNGRIKVVECFCDTVGICWKASIWSRSTILEEDNWHRDYKLDLCSDLVDNYTLHPELLSELQDNDDATPLQTTLERLYISHPRLSLTDDDDVVYLMAKVQPRDKKGMCACC
ncbi:hypothetical protein HU200_035399 [Digitaria exilis]|uniref:DUF1618 domain-containing protein n=1 Tax=Digitaria exilis TaxID=1010633 RepID=A0A835EIV0_9POAL|nr:hypothetical protein HU200_035398 [Digitaria exilis]KAF8697902.1 hypothetical protein HU200_035399 [Digitaria exilis]